MVRRDDDDGFNVNRTSKAFFSSLYRHFLKKHKRKSLLFVVVFATVFAVFFPKKVKYLYRWIVRSCARLTGQLFFETAPSSYFKKSCLLNGIGSLAPSNYVTLDKSIATAVRDVKRRHLLQNNGNTNLSGLVIVCTTVNEEASRQNLGPFLESLKNVQPSLLGQTIIFCLDLPSIDNCKKGHENPDLCLHMDLGVPGVSLAPVARGKDSNTQSYWRLTYGRVYSTLSLHSEGVSVMPVDVDSVFLKNPFAPGESLAKNPHAIAAVADARAFYIEDTRSKDYVNGGFLYFPATNPKTAISSNYVLRNIWSQSCLKMNEQEVTTKALRTRFQEMSDLEPLESLDPNKPFMLPVTQFLNLCNTDCGTGFSGAFAQARSLDDLHAMERQHGSNPAFQPCTREFRKDWVFFHAACKVWPGEQKRDLAKAKGELQAAVMKWVRES